MSGSAPCDAAADGATLDASFFVSASKTGRPTGAASIEEIARVTATAQGVKDLRDYPNHH
jgi:hypothetical protein